MKTLFLFSLLFLISCSDDKFTRVETLKGFRILGIRATAKPEVSPLGAATLDLFVSDVDGGGRIINGTYEACIDPGISVGAEVNCDHDPSALTGASVINTTIPDLANNLFTGYTGSVSVTVPANIFLGRSDREKFNGVGYIVIFRFDVDGKTHTAFKRVVATNRGTFNSNPAGSTVYLNGAPLTTIPGKDDKLRISGTTPETYSYQNIDGSIETKSEDLEVGWFVSEGKLDQPKADYGDTVKYLDDTPTNLLLVAIVRDDRGGVEIVRFFQ